MNLKNILISIIITEYHYENYTIIKCHSLEGNRDVYIGNKDLKLSDII